MRVSDLGIIIGYCPSSSDRNRRICRWHRNDKVIRLWIKIDVRNIYYYGCKIEWDHSNNSINHDRYDFCNIGSCGPNWSSIDKVSLFYNWYLMILGFFIPTSIVIASNVSVFNVSRKVSYIRYILFGFKSNKTTWLS